VRLALAFLTLFLAGAATAQATPAVIHGADPESYSLDLRYLRHGNGVLNGSERIEFANRGPAPLASVWLRLWANGPDRCRPRRIAVRIEAPAKAGTESVRCSALEVRLPAALASGATTSLSLTFRVDVRKADDRFGHAGKIALLGNVIPVLAVEDDRGLHLERYSPSGESFYSLAARWDATLRVPARLRAATTGAVRSERVRNGLRTLHVGTSQARDFGLAIGPLRVRTTTTRGVRIRAFARAGARNVGASLRAARRTVDALSRRLAPYGGRELDMVLLGGGVGGFGGMEYPELIFTMPFGNVVAHEIAHQWWYGLVGDDQFHEPWLDESFASYFEERLYPLFDLCDPRRPYGVVSPRRRGFALDSSMQVWDRTPVAYGEVVYLAGSCALQRLERDLGRSRMTAVLRLLQSRFRFGVMRKSDVLDAIRQVAPRYDLAAWLRLAHLSSP
jgi:Peptidase family M1 domain